MADRILIIDLNGVTKVPFMVSDYYYSRPSMIDTVVNSQTREEAISTCRSAISGILSDAPLLMYSDGKYPSKVIEALHDIIPNIYTSSYNSTNIIKLHDERYTWGALFATPNTREGTDYQSDVVPVKFPVVDTKIGYWAGGNSYSFNISYSLSVVPESAIVDGVIQFSPETLPNGIPIVTISAAYRRGGSLSTTTFAGPFVSDGMDYVSSLAYFNGTLPEEYVPGTDPNRPNIPKDDPYGQGGNQGQSGGKGNFNDGESENLRPLIPDGSAGPDTSKLGLYTRYLMTPSQIREFGDYLYADDIVESITQGIMKALFDSPAEAVISLMHYPFNVSSLVSTSSSEIYYGNMPTGKSSSGIMNKSSARIEWGVLNLTEFWGNFLDYAPHTKIDLYLPWCVGSVPIDPHECLPGTLEVITNIEFDKGTCIHSVIGNKGAVIGTYSGVVGTQIPVTALDSAGKGLAMVTAAVAGMASAGATGIMSRAAAGPSAARAYGAVMSGGGSSLAATRAFHNTEANIMAARERQYSPLARTTRNTSLAASAAAFRIPPNITRNGSFSGAGAGLGIQVPYIIISRPTQSVPQNYGRHYGYPSNIYSSLGSLVGYTEVGSIHLDGFSCTVEERNEIEELLIGGVML